MNTSDTQRVIEALLPMANGRSEVSARDVCRARIAIAHAYHYGGGMRWLTAYHAYGEALDVAAANSDEEAECLLQRAALLMELSQSSKGSLADCRRACRIISARVPARCTRVHATAALIHAEALFLEEKYEEALAELQGLSGKWPQCKREIAGAAVFAGIALHKLGRDEEAKALLAEAAGCDMKPDDLFRWKGKFVLPSLDAALWLAALHDRSGNTEEAEVWRQYVRHARENYSDTILLPGETRQ